MYERTDDLDAWDLTLTVSGKPLRVRVAEPTLQARSVMPAVDRLLRDGRPESVTRAAAMLARPFADSLIAWDLHWKGHLVPATRAGVLRVDQVLILVVLREWMAAWSGMAAQEQDDDAALADVPMIPLSPDALPEAG